MDSYDVSVQMCNTGEGREWAGVSASVGYPVLSEDSVSIPTYVLTHTRTVVASSNNLSAIVARQNQINNAEFDGHPAGAVLFESAPASSAYDYQRQVWLWRMQYRFQIRLPDADGTQRTWNHFWRTPAYQMETDANGNSTGVFKLDSNGNKIPMADARGAAGWDTYSPAMYQSGDFSQLGLGL